MSTPSKDRELTFSDVVQLIRKDTGIGYADAAQILDKAIEPHIKESIASLKQSLVAEIPKKEEIAPNGMSVRIGWNAAIDQFNTIINKVFNGRM